MDGPSGGVLRIAADVAVVGGGAAGMYAAIAARRQGADVVLLDKNLIGRGGATVMAQMTVAAALSAEEPDDWRLHYEDTLAGGRELCVPELAELLCREAPDRILESQSMGVKWRTHPQGGGIVQVHAPGHSRKRCCFCGVLGTGIGVSTGLHREVRRLEIRRQHGVMVTEVVLDSAGRTAGLAGFDVNHGNLVEIWAPAVVLACGGLNDLYERNSGSITMTADAHALALRAGAELIDMEMVQFFPIAHLAPRIRGLDPIMWDPFRYRLGGRLLNGKGEEFIDRYAAHADNGVYTATRDVVTYAIYKEVQEGRGSPAGGVWLDFREVPLARMREAFAPAVDKLLEQGIDLTQRAVEVSPMTHYMLGGVRVDARMATRVAGLFAAGEAVGGAHGANRLSGNAITEALVFGHRAGNTAGASRRSADPDSAARDAMGAAHQRSDATRGINLDGEVTMPQLRTKLKNVMWQKAGPFRGAGQLAVAAREVGEIEFMELPRARVNPTRRFNTEWLERFELENMLLAAKAIIRSAQERKESRGAHQREDFEQTDPEFRRHGVVSLVNGRIEHRWQELSAVP